MFRLLQFCFFYLLTASVLCGQTATISGTVSEPSGAPAIGAYIEFANADYRAVTDVDGQFSINKVATGNYELTVSFVGAEDYAETVVVSEAGQKVSLNIKLQESSTTLGLVTVKAKSNSALQEIKPVTVTSIDATKLRTQSLEVPELMRRSTGLLVRRNGGVGSQTRISLNGLQGGAVRRYYDGIPIQYYGGGLSLDILPAGAIERIDVYKGVMPVSVGTDALGGGVNIVSRGGANNLTEASYEIGSFNMHRVMGYLTRSIGDKGAYFGVNFFANYADNDFEMRNIANRSFEEFENRFGQIETRAVEDTVTARRFHDRHRSAYAEARLGWADQKWADLFEVALAGATRDDQTQHGVQVTIRPVGEAVTGQQSLTGRLRYRKTVSEWLDIDYAGIASYGKDMIRDTTTAVYDWFGNVLPVRGQAGGELLFLPSDRDGTLKSTAHRLSFGAKLGAGLSLTASDFFAVEEVFGEDPFGIRLRINDEDVDVISIPATFLSNVAGVELNGSWLEDRLTAVIFGKQYYLNAEAVDVTARNATRLPLRTAEINDSGFGAGIRFALPNEWVAIRANFERATRLPTRGELFGDFQLTLPNYNLRPENSDNYNVGIRASKEFSNNRNFAVDINAFLRQQTDLIRLQPLNNQGLARFINEDEVDSKGLEVSAVAQVLNGLTLRSGYTFQAVSIAASEAAADETFIGTQIPNTPRSFLSAGVRYTHPRKLGQFSNVTIFYDYYTVERFSINYVADLDNANPFNLVPRQHQHDMGVSAELPIDGLTLALQVDNVANNILFDNFRVPKPGRAFRLKLTYRKF
ncbi:MAG: TonB-dependent receptor [Bacteroidota bacterium]